MKSLCSLILIISLLSGCAHTLVVGEFGLSRVSAGQSYRIPTDGWFVTDESMMQILITIEYYQQLCEPQPTQTMIRYDK